MVHEVAGSVIGLGVALLLLSGGGCGDAEAPAPPPPAATPAGGVPPPVSRPSARGRTEEVVRGILSRVLEIPASRIQGDSRFVDDLGADDASLARVLAACEEAFALTLRPEELPRPAAVADLVRQIERSRPTGDR